MPVNYKKLWIMLIEKNISKPQLRKMAGLSPATLTKMNKNEHVSLEVLTPHLQGAGVQYRGYRGCSGGISRVLSK